MSSANGERRRATASAKILIDVFLLMLLIGVTVLMYEQSGLRYVKPVEEQLAGFWERRSQELCEDAGQFPKRPASADPVVRLAWLHNVLLPYSLGVPSAGANRGSGLWDKYVGCQEPKTETITEDLLHFKLSKYDEFEGDSQKGFARISDWVDKYVQSRNQIYVQGHTDKTCPIKSKSDDACDAYNYELSYRRALYVAQYIDRHLRGLEKRPGADYTIYPLGMGRSQQPNQRAGEGETDWWRRCRRIVLWFRDESAAKRRGGGS